MMCYAADSLSQSVSFQVTPAFQKQRLWAPSHTDTEVRSEKWGTQRDSFLLLSLLIVLRVSPKASVGNAK